MKENRWTRIVGDGLVYSGPCMVKHLLFYPHTSTQHVDVYDGRDATTGKKFCRMRSHDHVSMDVSLGDGVRFDMGIYIDCEHREDEVTVVFMPSK